MDCEEIKLKVQALADSELDENEISEVLQHVESCYKCRNEYIELLKLNKRMKGVAYPEPEEEWFERMSKKPGRKLSSIIGQLLFFGSYILLIGWALFSLFSDNSEGLFIKLVLGGIFLGIIVLFGVTITDRIKESKTDRYKGVIK